MHSFFVILALSLAAVCCAGEDVDIALLGLRLAAEAMGFNPHMDGPESTYNSYIPPVVHDDGVCVPYHTQDFTACSLVNYPLYPVGLDLAVTEPIAAEVLAQINDPVFSRACQTALAMFTCSRTYPSCSSYGSIPRIVKPCRSICQNVHDICGQSLAYFSYSDSLNCTTIDAFGVPDFVEDGGECFTFSNTNGHKHATRAGPFDVPTIMTNTSLPQYEVEALIDLYVSANGAAWTNKTRWGTGDPCTWFGVSCTVVGGANTTIGISLSGDGLVGTIPASIGSGLPNLVTIDFANNMLSGTLPSSIGNLASLASFSVALNILSGTIPASFANLQNLVRLHLGATLASINFSFRMSYKPPRSNTFTGQLTNQLMAKWTKLQYFNLGRNKFDGVVPSGLGELTALKTIDISNNLFTSLNFSFEKLVNLIDFDATNCDLVGGLPTTVAPCQNMQYFSAALNGLTGTIPDAFSSLSNLTNLGILYNSLTGPMDKLLNLTKMTVLGTGYNMLSLPAASLCNFKLLSIISGYNNILTGDLPPCFATDLKALYLADFSNAGMTGTIPPELGNNTNLVLLSLVGNKLTGTLPPSFGNLPRLSNLYLGNMKGINSTLPVEWANITTLSALSIFGDNLYGTIPAEYCSLTKLKTLLLYDNKLTGTLPSCINKFTALQVMDISGNKISGQIPETLGAVTTLVTLRAHTNDLSGTVPPSFNRLTALQTLDLSNNDITQAFGDITTALHSSNSLTTLNIANNNIYGSIDYFQFIDGATGVSYFPMLIAFNLANNSIEGTIGSLLVMFSSLSSIDISYNNFTGALINVPQNIKVLIANGNPKLADPKGELPSYLKPTETFVKDQSGLFSCPALTGKNSQVYVQLDASYYNYTLCICERGYYGTKNWCQPCLEYGDCDSDPNRTSMIITPGYFPSPNATTPIMLVPCPQDTFSVNPCNPDASVEFECLNGHTGRLCSECLPGWRRSGFTCDPCEERIKIVTIFFGCVALIALYAYLLWPGIDMVENGLLKNFLFYAQAISYVLASAARWANPIPLVKQIYTGTNFDIGILGFDCFAQFTPSAKFLVTMFLPPLFAFTTALVYYGIIYTLKFAKKAVQAEEWKYRCYYAFFFVINALYFPICSKIFSAFSCTEDPVTGVSYLNSFPYIECNTSNYEYRTILSLAVVFLIPYVIGIPVLHFALMLYSQQWSNQDVYKKTLINYVTSFFIECYTQDKYYWEFIIFARKLAFSLFISLIPITSPFLSLAIFVVVLVSILLNSWKLPYLMNLTNVLDLVGFAVILLTFLSGILFSSPQYSSYSDPLAVVIFTLNILVVSAYVFSYGAILLKTRFPFLKSNKVAGVFIALLESETGKGKAKIPNTPLQSQRKSLINVRNGGKSKPPSTSSSSTSSSVDVTLSEYPIKEFCGGDV